MRIQRLGLSQKFILLVSLAVLIFLLAAFLNSRSILGAHALESANEQAALILDQTDKRLMAFTEEMRQLAEGLAGTSAVRRADPEGMRDLFLATVAARKRYLRAIYLGTADGRMYEWGQGRGFVNNEPVFPPGYDPRTRPWYREALRADGFAASSPYTFASVQELGITLVLPVRNGDGAFVGVLGLDILLDDMRAVLEDLDIPKGGKAFLLTPAGDIVASQFGRPRGASRALERFSVPGGEKVLSLDAGSFESELDGRAMRFVHKKTSEHDWIIVVAMPLDLIMRSTWMVLRTISLMEIILMIMLTLVLTGLSATLIIQPLSHIVSVINGVKAGKKGARADLRTGDEFGIMAAELNTLLDTVEDYSTHLEEKVRTRTGELAALQLENTRLGLLEERRRIYRDVHDTIGAKLTNIFFSNGVARELARSAGAAMPAKLAEMHDAIESNCLAAVQSLKELILGMKVADDSMRDLALFAREGVGRRLAAGGIAYECSIPDTESLDRLSPEARAELVKILDELASNTLKHSGASRARLAVTGEMAGTGDTDGTGGISIEWRDDGRGFDPAALRSDSSGIENVRFRVGALGGTVVLDSAPGAGTRCTIRVRAGEPRAAAGGRA